MLDNIFNKLDKQKINKEIFDLYIKNSNPKILESEIKKHIIKRLTEHINSYQIFNDYNLYMYHANRS